MTARRRRLGFALMLPLALVLTESVRFGMTCDYDCGDSGGRGLFMLLLLCTPPAAVGVLVAAPAGAERPSGLTRLVRGLAVAAIICCTIGLIVATLAALGAGIHDLTTDPQVHRIGQTEPSAYERAQQREGGVLWLVVAAVLAAMSTGAVLALRAAYRRAG
jgi:hypothetical protein